MERLSWCTVCLNHASFRLWTVARRGSCGPTRKLSLLHTQWLVLCSLGTWFQNLDFFLESASMLHVSQPKRRMEVTRDLYNLNLLAKLMVLHCQILCILTIAAIAEAILIRISAEHVLSLHRVAPRYLKLVTSSKFWPLTLISALMLFMLFVKNLALFCADFHSICRCSA